MPHYFKSYFKVCHAKKRQKTYRSKSGHNRFKRLSVLKMSAQKPHESAFKDFLLHNSSQNFSRSFPTNYIPSDAVVKLANLPWALPFSELSSVSHLCVSQPLYHHMLEKVRKKPVVLIHPGPAR